MEELKKQIKEKIKVCASAISDHSNSEMDLREAQAIEHLTKALSYLVCLNQLEREEN